MFRLHSKISHSDLAHIIKISNTTFSAVTVGSTASWSLSHLLLLMVHVTYSVHPRISVWPSASMGLKILRLIHGLTNSNRFDRRACAKMTLWYLNMLNTVCNRTANHPELWKFLLNVSLWAVLILWIFHPPVNLRN